MVDPNYALQSQQFAQDAENQSRQRSIAYDEMGQRPWLQLPQTMQNQQALNQQSRAQGFREQQAMREYALQQRDMKMQEAQSAERINSMQIERAVAAEALGWSRELHTTDMLALQRRSVEAQTRMIELQAEEAARKANLPQVPRGMEQEAMDAIRMSGMDVAYENGRFTVKRLDGADRDRVIQETQARKQRTIAAEEARTKLLESQAQENMSRADYYRSYPTKASTEPRLLLQAQLRANKDELGRKDLTPEQRASLLDDRDQMMRKLNSMGEGTSAGEDIMQEMRKAFSQLDKLEVGNGE